MINTKDIWKEAIWKYQVCMPPKASEMDKVSVGEHQSMLHVNVGKPGRKNCLKISFRKVFSTNNWKMCYFMWCRSAAYKLWLNLQEKNLTPVPAGDNFIRASFIPISGPKAASLTFKGTSIIIIRLIHTIYWVYLII